MKLNAVVGAVLFSVISFAAEPIVGEAFNTESAPRDVRLENGVAVHLAARSTGTVFSDHTVIDQGAVHLRNFSGYKVQAGALQIESDKPNTQAAIRVQQNTIEVASIGGDLRVFTGGEMLTRVVSGTRMSFQNSGATPAQSGATHAPRHWSETKTWICVVVGISAAALAIGLTAAAQGKSPF